MSNTDENNEKTPARPWVKLYLAKQADSCLMPPFIVGTLQNETQASYLLNNVLEPVPDDGHPAGFIMQERRFPDYVSRTYVYRVEILGVKPDLTEFYGVPQESSFGGMG